MLYFIQSIDLLAAGEAFLHWFRIIRPLEDAKFNALFFIKEGNLKNVQANAEKKSIP